MDLTAAITKIEEMANKSRDAKEISPKGWRRKFLIQNRDGSLDQHDIEPPLLDLKTHDPESLIRFIRDFMDGTGDAVDPGFQPILVYNQASIAFIPDPRDKTIRASCDLNHSFQFARLAQMAGDYYQGSPPTYAQKELISLLRTDLHDCAAKDNSILSLIRNLRWSNQSEADIQHGKESLGKQVLAATTGEGTIPEQTTFEPNVYQTDSTRQKVVCSIDLNADSRTFVIHPLPGEIESAITRALDRIVEPFQTLLPTYRGEV